MPVQLIFTIQLLLGYLAWILCFRVYLFPRLRSLGRLDAHRLIATLHSFRFFGLVFLVPGVVGPHLPAVFASLAAWGDFATGILALLALLAFRNRPLFMTLTMAFNLVGIADLVIDYTAAMRLNLPAVAGQLGATWAIPVLYVPLLMITHVVALYWLLRPQPSTQRLVREAQTT
jgi:hypothetical protein